MTEFLGRKTSEVREELLGMGYSVTTTPFYMAAYISRGRYLYMEHKDFKVTTEPVVVDENFYWQLVGQ